MDISILAQSVAVYLAPFLPYLIKAGERAAEEAGKKFGDDAWNKAKSIWAKLGPKVEAKPAALDSAQDVAESPDDEDAVDSLRRQIKKLLSEDSELAAEIAPLIPSGAVISQVTASGRGSVAIGRDAVGSTIVTGMGNSVGNTEVIGDENVIGNSNTVTVSKGDTQGITLDEFTGLITQLRELIQESDLNNRTLKVIDADAELIEDEAKLDQPSLPLIETKLKSIEALVQSTAGIGSSITTLVPIIQRALEYAQVLFR